MALNLDQWQERMEHHFEALAKSRSNSGLPLFVLEHGLSGAETDQIAKQLRARLANGKRLAPHWLLWAIYAAERGYTYEGGEYWQSFEETTPGWAPKDRYRLSAWFSRFRETYNGFKPSGSWAMHFSIIAWPITHAVLPRYLQFQFARTLYALRFQLARLRSIDPAAIGHLVATNVYDASTRFEQFLQQQELVGRMVLALLHQQDAGEGEDPLLPATLARIVNDLETIRNARGWIKETSRVVSDRFKGLSRGEETSRRGAEPRQAPNSDNQQNLDIRPHLRLNYQGQGHWDLQVDLPSFKKVAALNPDLREFLMQTRCLLNGSPVKKPPAWVLSGRRQAVLREWPDPERPLIGFERHHGVVSHLLESECRISKGPYWLFRVANDGMAREIRGCIVRPGKDYILASKSPVYDLMDGMEPCKINCPNISALRIRVPQDVSEDYAQWLKIKGLVLARTIRIWPAGFPGRQWDGEGRSEWLTTEKPTFGISSDHSMETYEITLQGSESRTIKAASPGTPTFVQLSELSAGRHQLTVRAERTDDRIEGSNVNKGMLELHVREPEPWMPGAAAHAGLIVSIDPYDASLDQFWHNDCEVSIFGPAGRRITPQIVLQNSADEQIFSQNICGTLELPVRPDVWAKHFSDFLKRERWGWRYLEAESGLLIINGDDLGRYIMRLEYNVLPIRWVLRESGEGVLIRLVDESGQEDAETTCDYFPMERPKSCHSLDLACVFDGISVHPPGGLFVAKSGRYSDAVVVSSGLKLSGLDGLGVRPDYGRTSGAPKSIAKLLININLWRQARVAGPLAGVRRRQVTNALLHGAIGVLAGCDWADAEQNLIAAENPLGGLDHLNSLMTKAVEFARHVSQNAPTVDRELRSLKLWYAETARRFRICFDQGMCDFAIDFACRPNALPSLYPDDLLSFVQRAQAEQTLLRGARLAVFSIMRERKQQLSLIAELNI